MPPTFLKLFLSFSSILQWLAEDIAKWVTNNKDKDPAEVDYGDFPIYYAVCSYPDKAGGMSLCSIYMNELQDILEKHDAEGTLGRCRFFTT